jgi:uncharacterized protein (DUF2384 family)
MRPEVSTTLTNPETNQAQPPARFISLSVRAGEVFPNREKAVGWLDKLNPSLQGRAPIDAWLEVGQTIFFHTAQPAITGNIPG